MAPKSKTKSSFEKCDECDIILSSKDMTAHVECCHGNATTPSSRGSKHGHGFINGLILHGLAKTISEEDESCQNLPSSNDIVWLNPSAMARCRIIIGSYVLLWKTNSTFTVKTARPSRETINLTVGVTAPTMDLLRCGTGDILHLTKLAMTNQKPAIELTLQVLKKNVCADTDLLRFLAKVLDGKHIVPGCLLMIDYYGKLCKFRVSEIDGDIFQNAEIITANRSELFDSSYLCEDLSQIDLNQDMSLDGSFVARRRPSDDNSKTGSHFIKDSNLSHGATVSSTPKRRTPRKATATKGKNDFPSNDIRSDDARICPGAEPKGELETLCRNSARKVCACVETMPSTSDVTYYVDRMTRVKLVGVDADRVVETKKAGREVTFASIGGLSKQIEQILQIINLSLTGADLFEAYGVQPQRGIILFGPSGTGKSLLGRAIAHSMKDHFLVINGPELYSKFYGETEAKLRQIFQDAKQKAPSVIFIDEIDSLCPKRDSSSSQQEQRVVATLLTLMDGLPVHPSERVVVVAATNKPDRVDPALRRPGRLDREIEIGIPTAQDREQILQCLLSGVKHDLSHSDINAVASNAHGYVGADLAAICAEAVFIALKRLDSEEQPSLAISYSDIVTAAKGIKPSALREFQIEIPNVQWEDVGGQDDLKLKLRQAVEWPLKNPESFLRFGVSPPRGILMYGPPGCSKTLIAKALATESHLNFIAIKGPELFNKWVGESERAIREVFRKARAASPSIVYFDEIEAVAGERGSSSSSSQVGDRVLAQLLTEMDGLEQLRGVTVVASTNRPDMIDKALLRPGRFDRIVYVPLPDDSTRRAIFAIQFRRLPIDIDVSVDELVSSTSGYSGAEVVAVCDDAALKAMEENLENEVVKMVHFRQALLAVTPRISMEMLEFYEMYSSKAK